MFIKKQSEILNWINSQPLMIADYVEINAFYLNASKNIEGKIKEILKGKEPVEITELRREYKGFKETGNLFCAFDFKPQQYKVKNEAVFGNLIDASRFRKVIVIFDEKDVIIGVIIK